MSGNWLLAILFGESQLPRHLCVESRLQHVYAQQTRDIHTMLVYCRYTVHDAGQTSNQRWVNVSCLLRYSHCGSAAAVDTWVHTLHWVQQSWNTTGWPSAGLILVHRLRRLDNIAQHWFKVVGSSLWTMLAARRVHTIYPPIQSWARMAQCRRQWPNTTEALTQCWQVCQQHAQGQRQNVSRVPATFDQMWCYIHSIYNIQIPTYFAHQV